MTAKTVALIGTFDTKGEEFSFLRERRKPSPKHTLNSGFKSILPPDGIFGDAYPDVLLTFYFLTN